MKVVFAPDWRKGVPYQRLLAEHLTAYGVEVVFMQDYRRAFPLYRGLRNSGTDIVHIHWPEAYWPVRGNLIDYCRLWRYPIDLHLAHCRHAIAYTLHNLWPHNSSPNKPGIKTAVRATLKTANVIFAHSQSAADEAVSLFDVDPAKFVIIPHGDLSPDLGPPQSPTQAREQLHLDSRPIAVVFGRIEPYKGIENLIIWWKQNKPQARLFILGEATPEYAQSLTTLADSSPDITFAFRRIGDAELGLWLSAANCVLFNYLRILTSGAASLARSWGTPILLPERLNTINLDEPFPNVFRFHDLDNDFPSKLEHALTLSCDYAAAQPWREGISWNRIARDTAAAYHRILAN
jgi:beta-1,4-mannosyltransferase